MVESWVVGIIVAVVIILITCLIVYKLMVIVHQAEGMVIERLGRFHKVCGASTRKVFSCDVADFVLCYFLRFLVLLRGCCYVGGKVIRSSHLDAALGGRSFCVCWGPPLYSRRTVSWYP